MFRRRKWICIPVVLLFFLWINPMEGYAAEGYQLIIDDRAELLTQAEEAALELDMQGITEYGNVAFLTVDDNYASTAENYAKGFYRNHFGRESGAVFLIDMNNRKIWIVCEGSISRIIDNDYTEVITDNIYTYASREEYYTCAQKAFEQIYTLLEGGKIAQPMKYISNALLALGIALIINFLILRKSMGKVALSEEELLENVAHKYILKNKNLTVTNVTRVYSPPSSGSSGGGGGGSRGGGGSFGGGGSSGGHSF